MDRKMLATILSVAGFIGVLYFLFQIITDFGEMHQHLYMLSLFAILTVVCYPVACYGLPGEIHSLYLLDKIRAGFITAFSIIGVLLLGGVIYGLVTEPQAVVWEVIRREVRAFVIMVLFAFGVYYQYHRQRRKLKSHD
jgi:uncharacterized membrane protein